MIAGGQLEVRGTTVPLLLCTATSTQFTSLNSEWERVLGWTQQELTSRPFADFIHPNDRDRTLAEAAKVGLPGYEVVNFENRFRARGGRWRRLRWTARADGANWVAVAMDVTDETQVETQPAPAVRAGPVVSGPPIAGSPAPPALDRRARDWDLRLIAVWTGFVAVCLLALVLAVRGIGSSSATGTPGIAEPRELLPHMFGPVDRAGPLYTLGPTAQHPPAMLGPRSRSQPLLSPRP